MSAKLFARVYDYVLRQNQQAVLLAMADHSHDDGTKCFPSVDLLAWKLGCDRRTIQRIMRQLEKMGAIVCVGNAYGGAGNTREYHIHLEALELKPSYETKQEQIKKGDNLPPFTENTKKGDISDQKGDISCIKGDTAVPPEPLITLNNHIPSYSPSRWKDVQSLFSEIPIFENARDLHDWCVGTLQADGWDVSTEVPVDDRGDGRGGKVDVVACKDGGRIAIELDQVSPRHKSITKLQQIPDALRLIILRLAPSKKWDVDGITVLHPDTAIDQWQPEDPLVQDMAKQCEVNELCVQWAVGKFIEYQNARGGRMKSIAVAFERWFKDRAKDLSLQWWNMPSRDWSAPEWAYFAFGGYDGEVKDITYELENLQTARLPRQCHKLRDEWDAERCGPPPWHAETNVPTVLIERFKPWFADKLRAQKSFEVRKAMDVDLAAGNLVRIAPEWKPSADEAKALSEKYGLMFLELDDQVAEFVKYFSKAKRGGKPVKVKSPIERLDAWLGRSIDDIRKARTAKPQRGKYGINSTANKPQARVPSTSQEWIDWLGDPDDAANMKVKRQYWATLLNSADDAVKANPWETYNAAIPMDVFLHYAPKCGWVPMPEDIRKEMGT